MVGNSKERFTDFVSICYPKYEQGNALLAWRHQINVGLDLPILGSDEDDNDGCINFRYGTAPLVDATTMPNYEWNVRIPIGIRSIGAKEEGDYTNSIYVFAVEPTGNFIGTIKTNKTSTPNRVPGDIDGDRDVDQDDYDAFMDALGSKEGDPNYNPAADLDNDGDVDLYDYYLFKQNYGQGTSDVPGDLDGNGEVTQVDSELFQQALGSNPGDANWNPAADLDDDQDVDLYDYYLFKEYFN